MDDVKGQLLKNIEKQNPGLFSLACDIFDRPECDYEEHYAAGILTDYLEKLGFSVQKGVAGLPTAFRAAWENGSGGPTIGFLGEYDALKGMGHACGHHLQTPVCIGAAVALKESFHKHPYRLVIYGTPAEETTGGKIIMAQAGLFDELDVALGYHSGHLTGVSGTSKALQSVTVTFKGTPSHAAGAPELGRSALDAMVLAFHGAECLREHLVDGSRVHYTVRENTGPSNIVHEKAVAAFTLRAPDRGNLESMTRRFEKILQGATFMTETTYEAVFNLPYYNFIQVPSLNQIGLANEKFYSLTNIQREEGKGGGSTDFGNVSWIVPSLMVSTFYCDAPAHSHEWVCAGKSEAARSSITDGAAVLAATALDLISDPSLLKKVKEEWREKAVL